METNPIPHISQIKEELYDNYIYFHTDTGTEHKTPDISVLPPCQSVLKLHARRANYVACIWKNSLKPILDPPSILENGWLDDNSAQWIDIAFPDSITDILFDEAYEEERNVESDVESENED